MVMEIVISVILLIVGIISLVVIHVCIVGRIFRTGFQTGTMVQRSSTRMSNEDLKNLPCFDYKAAEKGSSPVDCVVCLESFRVGEKCRLLPICKHSFHSQCIDSWLLKTPICPICRTYVNPPQIGVFLGEESSVSGNVEVELA